MESPGKLAYPSQLQSDFSAFAAQQVTNPHLSSSVNGIPDAALHKFKHLLQKRSISKEIVLALGTYNMKVPLLLFQLKS